jgi:alkylglycerol monooxygenase
LSSRFFAFRQLANFAVRIRFYDFCYYWQRRLGHIVGLFRSSHWVHYQSKEFNLTTALRQPGTGALPTGLFYIPMA